MSKRCKPMWWASLTVAALFVLSTSQVQAGPFLDWLLGRPILTYPSTPVATVAPVTANYPVVGTPVPQTAACCPTTAGYAAAPAAVAAPTVVAQPVLPVQQARPLVVGYAPTYRSSWYRVPVTYYRPMTTYTGVAAQPVTSMYPCNTFAYQVQRQPLLFQRPWLPALAPSSTAVYAPVVSQPVVAGAQPAPCACGHSGAVLPGATTTVPMIGSPGVIPGTTSPGTVLPGTTVPGTSVPADSAPTLIPGSSIPGSSLPAGSVPGSTSFGPADQAPSFPPNSVPGAYSEGGNTQANGPTSASVRRVAPGQSNSVYQVKPIPDPELKNDHSTPPVVAPPLLNPRERTASQASSGARAVTAAVYKTPITQPAARSVVPVQATAKPAFWDDQGWQSAR